MNNGSIADRLRNFMLLLAGLCFIGTVVELWFIGHMETTLQFTPYILSAVGLITVTLAWLYPSRKMVPALRVVMAILFLSGFFGMAEHLYHNWLFELEIRPNTTSGEALAKAFTGANPLLAPGILSLAATLAIASTYGKLRKREDQVRQE